MLNTIEEIKQALIRSYDPERIILYGSYARGAAGERSDVDMLILKDTEKTPVDRRIEVEKILEHRGLPLDIMVYTPQEMRYLYSIGSPFIEEVIETGRVLYMRKAAESWLKDAEDDVSSAIILLKHEKFKGACYHSQQSVEKGLKALILEKGGRPGRVHDIVELLKEVQKLGWDVSLSIDDAIFLNSIYKGRYPTEEGLLPMGEPSKKDAEMAVKAAGEFMRVVRKAL